ncbi:MAG: T9SS type A sorting domain-containing protein [Bacteroidetes bacterium]|nr:T9SS type A sorting domain-containing protein [Bacteroidota bacterium]
MKQKCTLLTGLLFSCAATMAQPSATPAANYAWVKTSGNQVYTSGPTSTTPSISSGPITFGQAGDSDPASPSTTGFCSGNADGNGLMGVSLFGAAGYPTTNNSTCEQRAVNLTQWTNAFPDAGVTNGASSGTVYLPTAATLTILKAPASTGSAGTTMTTNSGSNVGKLFGGNSGGTTQVKVTYNYSLQWETQAFGGISNSASPLTNNWVGGFTANDPGGSNYSAQQDWQTGGFGTTLSSDINYSIPVSSISQSGGTFEVAFASDASINLQRTFGNADAFTEAAPGMEGRAQYQVTYDVWQIQSLLALHLLNFYGEAVGDNAVLHWQSADESGNRYYTIERSTDGVHWNALGNVPIANNRSGTNYDYQYKDIAPGTGNFYYRLKLTEWNGSIAYTNIIAVKTNHANEPVMQLQGKQLMITGASFTGTVMLYNATGHLIMSKTVNPGGQNTFDLQQLPAGFYIALIRGNQTVSTKFVLR